MNPYLLEAFSSLWAAKQRTALVLIGIVIGVGSVISMVSIGQIIAAEATREFRTLGTDLVTVRVYGYENNVPLAQRMVDMPRYTPCVKTMSPYQSQFKEGRRSTRALFVDDQDVKLVEASQEFAQLSNLPIASGRFLSNFDAPGRFGVLGSELALRLSQGAAPESVLGKEIRLDNHVYTVIGILAPSSRISMISIDPNETLFTLGDIKEKRSSVSAVGKILPMASVEACTEQIEAYFQRRSPEAEVSIETAQELIDQMRKQADLIGTLLAAVGAISLIMGGVGIMNIMLSSVSERQQEIGIRRALGAHRSDIRYLFLAESLVLALLGGALGVVSSILVTFIASRMNDWEFFLTMMPILLGAGVSIAIGVFFGLFPAHQAANLDPIEALSSD